jgi:hypothetical protein
VWVHALLRSVATLQRRSNILHLQGKCDLCTLYLCMYVYEHVPGRMYCSWQQPTLSEWVGGSCDCYCHVLNGEGVAGNFVHNSILVARRAVQSNMQSSAM